MGEIKKRIKTAEQLLVLYQEKYKKRTAILTYRDGSKQEMTWMDAFKEIGSGADVVNVQYPTVTGCTLLAAMIPGKENQNLDEDLPEVE